MAKQSNEAFFWVLFSAGGVVAALLIPVQLFLFGVAIPSGLAAASELRTSDGPGQVSADANLPVCVVFTGTFSLGAPVSLYALRRSSGQAFKRSYLYSLLRRRCGWDGSGSLLALDHLVAQHARRSSKRY